MWRQTSPCVTYRPPPPPPPARQIPEGPHLAFSADGWHKGRQRHVVVVEELNTVAAVDGSNGGGAAAAAAGDRKGAAQHLVDQQHRMVFFHA